MACPRVTICHDLWSSVQLFNCVEKGIILDTSGCQSSCNIYMYIHTVLLLCFPTVLQTVRFLPCVLAVHAINIQGGGFQLCPFALPAGVSTGWHPPRTTACACSVPVRLWLSLRSHAKAWCGRLVREKAEIS
jgi:hypothetical protein